MRFRFFIFLLLFTLRGAVLAVPTVTTLNPAPGATVSALTQISVTFSEAVTGIDADDLSISGDTPQLVSGAGAGPYVFTFTQPQAGTVNVEWTGDNSIVAQGGGGAFIPGGPWSYTLVDTVPPTVFRQTPAANATVTGLSQVEVVFSEPVTGVTGGDLLVSGVPATSVTGSGQGPYVFSFDPQAIGLATFSWAAGHGIQDTAATPNNFAGGSWNVTRGAAGAGTVVINEFLASNGVGLADENGDRSEWIELYNPGTAAVDLTGWALTDRADELGQWVFPSRLINPGAYMIVFASGKDRRPATGNLHTNFSLNANGGFLALVGPDFPRVAVSSFDPYPEQRTDFSYGAHPAGGLRYFSPATPNAANSTNSFLAVTPKVNASVNRGIFKDPFDLVLSCSDSSATIRYTTNFTEPTASNGTVYTGPITITATTCLRAVAFGTGSIPSLPVTHSYVFLDQVPTQPANPATFPVNWGPHASFTGGVVPADYGMDTDPVRVDPNNAGSAIDPVKQQRLKDGLRELPILSVTIPMIDMFGANGIYYATNVQNKTFGYKKCAVEMLLPDGSTAFSTICGISGHGNASRDPLKNPKHGFQLKFKGDLGPGSLDYQLFPDSPATSFDDIILRPDFGTSWRHWSDDLGQVNGSFQRTRATRLRDAFVKDTFHDMGGLASHHRFFHLFINGLYWGTYDFAEQPVDSFAKNYLGGAKTDYDVIHEGVLKAGDMTVYNAMNALPNITTSALYEQMKGYLDVPSFIDYTLLHFYIGHQDWGLNKNWYALRRRASAANPTQGKYQYIPWDDECTLMDTTVNRVATTDLPTNLHPKLILHPQYRLDFADRVHKHLVAPGGALTAAANVGRWQKWQAIMDKPIVAESARWGDYRRDVHPYQSGAFVLYTRESQWLAENTRLTGTYFPGRPTTLLSQLQSGNLYPSIAAPEYRQSTAAGALVGSRRVNPGYIVAMKNPSGNGTLYYTTDGNDPHIYYTPVTGAGPTSVAASAKIYDPLNAAAPLTINSTTIIKSRVLSSAGAWSALNEATFSVGIAATPVRITEIMYNPPNGNGGSAAEFVELQNVGASSVDLSGFYFEGIDFVFPLGFMLGAGDRIVLATNNAPVTFAAVYPGVSVAGYFGGSLDNSGERLALKEPSGRTVISVTYDDIAPWAVQADGGGSSLEIIDPDGDANSALNWKASSGPKGTPGVANSTLPSLGVKISEVLADNASAASNGGLFSSYVELQNISASAVDISGWRLITGVSVSAFAFPAGSVLPAGGFATVWLDGGSGGTGFHAPSLALSGRGGNVRLYETANLGATPIDQVEFGNQATNFSIGRVLVSTGPDVFAWRLTQPSPGSANVAASTAPAADLAINEWLTNPSALDTSAWFELYNRNATLPAALSGLSFQTTAELFQYRKLTFLNAQGYLRLNSSETGGDVDFTLPLGGTSLSILDASGSGTESVVLTSQAVGYSTGRLPDGSGAPVSFGYNSTPGAANLLVSYTGPRLNELLARNLSREVAPWGARSAWLELFNPGGVSADVSGMGLYHARTPSAPSVFRFPSGTVVPAGGYLVVWLGDPAGAVVPAGTLVAPGVLSGGHSGHLFLFDTANRVVDQIEYGSQVDDLPIGIDAGAWKLLANSTLAAANAGPAVLGAATSLRINEWLAVPPNGVSEFIELYNTNTAPVALAGLYLTDNPSTPSLTKSQIPPLSFIGGNGWVAFRAGFTDFEMSVNFSISSGGEYLRLSAADLSLIDAVSFGLQTVSASQGRVLDGLTVQGGLTPTMGSRNILPPAPSISDQPTNQSLVPGGTASFSVTATGSAPLSYQWSYKGVPIAGATSATLSLSNVTNAQDGAYAVTVTNSAGAISSNPAFLVLQQTFAQWQSGFFNASEANDPNIGVANADPDRDGLTNLQEYFHGLNPRSAATASDRLALPQVGVEPPVGTPQFITLTYRRSARATVGTVQLFSAPALESNTWTPTTPTVTEQLGPDSVTGDPRVRLKVALTPGDSKKFLRLSLTP